MKFTTITILILLLGTVLAVGQGSSYRSGTTIRIDESDSLSTNLMAAGRFIEHFGYINDDFYSASEHLMINGEVKDDAIAAARAISITGTIGDMFVGVGETVIIDGIIRGDLFAAGATIEITENAHIHGNVAV
ncbi:MAG: hypothetical protein R3211_11435, partial [Balneolaceae bacterium]|nr:hypothetical protein [Balneolaceae bacterium]